MSSPPILPRAPSLVPAFAALVASAIAMGISPIFVRLADVGPYTSAFWRVFLALPALYAWMKADRKGPPGRAFTLPVVLAGLAFAGDLFFWHLSVVHTSVANATFFATTAPIWVALFGWLIFRRKVSLGTLAGLSLCLLGGAALVAQSFALQPQRVVGDVFGLLTAIFFGLYFLAVGKARDTISAARVTLELSVITAAVLFAIAVAFEAKFWPTSVQGWLAVLGMALISHAAGQGLLSIALGRLPAMFSALVIFLEAIAAALFGWLILNEPVSLVQALGGVLILAGIFVSRPVGESGAR